MNTFIMPLASRGHRFTFNRFALHCSAFNRFAFNRYAFNRLAFVCLFLTLLATPLAAQVLQECGTRPSPNITLQQARPYGSTTNLMAYSPTSTKSVALALHIVRYSNGSGGLSDVEISAALAQLNTSFQTAMIRFVEISRDYIDNDAYANLVLDANFQSPIYQVNRAANALNIYFIAGSIATDNPAEPGTFRGAAESIPGRAMVMRNDVSNSGVFPHEVGHCLNLYHTFESQFGQECSGGGDCASQGDLVCDTPPDPGVGLLMDASVDANCNYAFNNKNTQGCGDPFSAYNPDTRNFMSYARDCRSRFSEEQIARMNYQLTIYSDMLYRVPVVLSNQVGGANVGGSTLSVSGGDLTASQSVASGNSIALGEGIEYTGKTNSERFKGYNGAQGFGDYKHNNWNSLSTQRRLQENFSPFVSIDPNTSRRIANFNILSAASVRNVLLDAPAYEWPSMLLRDPWYVSDAAGTQPDVFRTTPSTPVGAYNEITGGVFLNQGDPSNLQPPYYSVQALLTATANGITGYFQQWDAPTNASLLGTADPQTKNVLFTAASATVSARYKGHLASSVATPTGGSGQRRFVKDRMTSGAQADDYYTVYESAGQIWLTVSTDGGTTWQPEKLVGTGKNPSLAPTEGGVLVVWNDSFPSYGIIQSRFYNANSVSLDPARIISYNSISDACPVAAVYVQSYQLVAFEVFGSVSGGSGSEIAVSQSYGNVWGTPIKITGSLSVGDSYTPYPVLNPSLSFSGENATVHLVWQTSYGRIASGDAGLPKPIQYTGVNFGIGGTPITFSPSTPVSIAPISGYYAYSNPTIVTDATNTIKYLAWQANTNSSSTGYQGVVMTAQLSSSNVPSPTTVLRSTTYGTGEQYLKPSLSLEGSLTAVYFYSGIFGNSVFNEYGIKKFIYGQLSSITSTGTYPNVIARTASSAGKVAYTQTGTPYRVAFYPPASMMRSASVSENADASAGASVANSFNPASSSSSSTGSMMISRSTGVSFGDKGSDAFVSLSLDSLTGHASPNQSAGVASTVSPKALPDTLRTSAANLLSLLESESVNVSNAMKTVKVFITLRSKSLQSFVSSDRPVEVWAELRDPGTQEVFAASEKTTLTNIDTVKSIKANLDLTSPTEKKAMVVVRTSGLKVHENHWVEAMNLVNTQESAASSSNAALVADNSGTSASSSLTVALPTAFGLSQNYPNPFNPATTIAYQLPTSAKVSLKVFDVLGRVVAELVNDTQAAGYYQAQFNASKLSSGTYFYKLQAGDFTQTKRLTLVK